MEFFLLLSFLLLYSVYHKLEKINLLAKHNTIVLSYYEKLLLKKEIINLHDVFESRRLIRIDVDDKKYKKLVKTVVSCDKDFKELKRYISYSDKYKNSSVMEEMAEDAVYKKNHIDVLEILKIINKNKIKESGEKEEEWVYRNYGKNFFFSDEEEI